MIKKQKHMFHLDFDAEISNLISKILNFLSRGSSFEDSSFKDKIYFLCFFSHCLSREDKYIKKNKFMNLSLYKLL